MVHIKKIFKKKIAKKRKKERKEKKIASTEILNLFSPD